MRGHVGSRKDDQGIGWSRNKRVGDDSRRLESERTDARLRPSGYVHSACCRERAADLRCRRTAARRCRHSASVSVASACCAGVRAGGCVYGFSVPVVAIKLRGDVAHAMGDVDWLRRARDRDPRVGRAVLSCGRAARGGAPRRAVNVCTPHRWRARQCPVEPADRRGLREQGPADCGRIHAADPGYTCGA